MASPSVIDVIQLVFLLVSIPVYVVFLTTIVRFRKKHPFSSSFFTLCIVLGICDLQCLFSNWVLGKFSTFGWFYMDNLARKFNGVMAKIQVTLTIQGGLQQFTAVAIMAFNRWTAIVHIDKHDLIWTPRFLCCVLSFQVFVPLLSTVPILATPDSAFYPIDNFTGDIGTVSWTDPNLQLPYNMSAMVYLLLVNVVSIAFYSMTFWNVKKTMTQVQPNAAPNHNQRREVRLALIGLCLSSLLGIYAWVMYKMATAGLHDAFWWWFYFSVWGIVNDVFSWCNPWLCLVFSSSVREHMRELVCCSNNNKPQTSSNKSRRRPKPRHDDRVIELRESAV